MPTSEHRLRPSTGAHRVDRELQRAFFVAAPRRDRDEGVLDREVVARAPSRPHRLHLRRFEARGVELGAPNREQALLTGEAPFVDAQRLGALDLAQLLVGLVPTARGCAATRPRSGAGTCRTRGRARGHARSPRRRVRSTTHSSSRAIVWSAPPSLTAARATSAHDCVSSAISRPVQLGESFVHAPDAAERRAERVARVTLDDGLADRLRDRDRLLAHGDGFAVAPRASTAGRVWRAPSPAPRSARPARGARPRGNARGCRTTIARASRGTGRSARATARQ